MLYVKNTSINSVTLNNKIFNFSVHGDAQKQGPGARTPCLSWLQIYTYLYKSDNDSHGPAARYQSTSKQLIGAFSGMQKSRPCPPEKLKQFQP